LYIGKGGVMGNLAASLIEGTGANVKTKYNSMVRGLERAANGDDGSLSWILRNGAGKLRVGALHLKRSTRSAPSR
jgi:hypothetical protein